MPPLCGRGVLSPTSVCSNRRYITRKIRQRTRNEGNEAACEDQWGHVSQTKKKTTKTEAACKGKRRRHAYKYRECHSARMLPVRYYYVSS